MIRTATAFACLGLLVLPATADPATPKLHPVEAACIDYEMTGQMMNGTTTRCHRDYGYEIYEIENSTIGFGGFGQSQEMHRVTIGDTIYAIDLTTNSGTETTNPMYAQMVDAIEENGSEDISDAFLSAMGYSATGQTKTIAGVSCTVYASQMIGSACLTDDGLALEQNVMGNVMTAVSVSYEAGEDANYRRHETATITAGPDLSNGIPGMDLGDLLGNQ
ncbi:MAG: hypothetical protein AAFX86_03020 [Pseudomonadota bacterium]